MDPHPDVVHVLGKLPVKLADMMIVSRLSGKVKSTG